MSRLLNKRKGVWAKKLKPATEDRLKINTESTKHIEKYNKIIAMD